MLLLLIKNFFRQSGLAMWGLALFCSGVNLHLNGAALNMSNFAWADFLLFGPLLVAVTAYITFLRPFGRLKRQVMNLATGGLDMSSRINIVGWGEVREMALMIDSLTSGVQKVMTQVAEQVRQLDEEAGKMEQVSLGLTTGSKSMSDRIQAVANQSGQVRNVMETLNISAAAVRDKLTGMAQNMSSMSESANQAHAHALDNSNLTAQAISSAEEAGQMLKDFQNRASEIDKAVQSITTVAIRTRMLALNASIEAARAGKAGASFAVVARQVSELATQSSGSADIITKKLARVLEGADLISKTLNEMSTNITSAGELSSNLAHSLTEHNEIAGRTSSKLQEHSHTADDASVGAGQAVEVTRDMDQSLAEAAQWAMEGAEHSRNLDSSYRNVAKLSQTLRKAVDQFQRRSLRVVPPADQPLHMTVGNKKVSLIDISVGGFACRSGELTQGDRRKVRFKLPGIYGAIHNDVEVMKTWGDANCGCRFLGLSQRNQNKVAKYILNLRREELLHGPLKSKKNR